MLRVLAAALILVALTPHRSLATTEYPDWVVGIVCSVDWPCEEALEVGSCETGGTWDTFAYNASGPYRGWFQMDIDSDAMFDPWQNVQAAYRYWQVRGWRPWPYCGRAYIR